MKERRTVRDNGGRKQTDLITNIRLFAFFHVYSTSYSEIKRFHPLTDSGLKRRQRQRRRGRSKSRDNMYRDDKGERFVIIGSKSSLAQ